MYDADAKKKQRQADRSLRVGGFTYHRKPWTISLDRELEVHRDALSDFGEEYNDLVSLLAERDKRGKELPASKRPSEEKKQDAVKRLKSLDASIGRERMAMICTLLGPTEDGQSLTVDVLEEHLELEDISPIMEMLTNGETTVGGEDPTGDSESD